MKRFFSAFLSLILIFSCFAATATTANATSNDTITGRFSDGSYIYKQGDATFLHDAATGENLFVLERTKPVVNYYASHTPADLSPGWIYFHTDGPYKVVLNMSAVNRVIDRCADWLDLGKAMGITAGLAQLLWELVHGNLKYTGTTLWEIDDGYYYVADAAYFRIESYFYSDQNCTNLVDTESFTYHG